MSDVFELFDSEEFSIFDSALELFTERHAPAFSYAVSSHDDPNSYQYSDYNNQELLDCFASPNRFVFVLVSTKYRWSPMLLFIFRNILEQNLQTTLSTKNKRRKRLTVSNNQARLAKITPKHVRQCY